MGIRQYVEKKIVALIVERAILHNYLVSVNDGEEVVLMKSRDKDAILKAMFSTDEDVLIISDSHGERIGVIHFVYGNDGVDVVHDHSAVPRIDDLVAAVEAFIEEVEEA